ncbi:hypothetical protein BDV06DRAFT_191842 [Aspergillus oleicola]
MPFLSYSSCGASNNYYKLWGWLCDSRSGNGLTALLLSQLRIPSAKCRWHFRCMMAIECACWLIFFTIVIHAGLM